MQAGGPRILLVDIETAPDVVYTWSVYESNAIAVKDHWYLLSFSAKWLEGWQETWSLDQVDNEQALLFKVWHLLDAADIVVAHNGREFDIKKLNARFIAHRMLPPSPFAIVDTVKELQRIARFSSNKLDWIGDELGLGRKVKHEGFPLWEACMKGDHKAFARMRRYNAQDVRILEKLYLRLAPWMKQPNGALWHGGLRCVNPACRAKKLQWRGYLRSRSRMYSRYQCQVCGKWAQTPKAETIKAAVVPI